MLSRITDVSEMMGSSRSKEGKIWSDGENADVTWEDDED